MGYRMAVGTARAKFGRWLQELQRLRQARKKGAASIGLITAEMIKVLLSTVEQDGILTFQAFIIYTVVPLCMYFLKVVEVTVQ